MESIDYDLKIGNILNTAVSQPYFSKAEKPHRARIGGIQETGKRLCP